MTVMMRGLPQRPDSALRLTSCPLLLTCRPVRRPFVNALAETTIGLYKTELINRRGPWKAIDQVELATLEWVDWYNHRRLHGACEGLPPVEFEQTREQLGRP